MTQTLTPEESAFYRRNGFLLAKQKISSAARQLAQTVLENWSNAVIAGWKAEGLINVPEPPDLDFSTRMAWAWNAAGKPGYRRSPQRNLSNEHLFHLLSHPDLVDVAEDLLGTDEISIHGIFNGRPKIPGQPWAVTPWHQDGQYLSSHGETESKLGSAADTHVLTMWIPLQPVDENSGCIVVAPSSPEARPIYPLAELQYGSGIGPQHWGDLSQQPVPMETGDVLCFNQRTPHRSVENVSGKVIWSIDVRYEATEGRTLAGEKYGGVVRSADPNRIISCDEWLSRFEALKN